jgi:hypothetical protein
MTRPIISGLNYLTGEHIEREMNDDELAQYEADKAAAPDYVEPITEVPAPVEEAQTSTDAG